MAYVLGIASRTFSHRKLPDNISLRSREGNPQRKELGLFGTGRENSGEVGLLRAPWKTRRRRSLCRAAQEERSERVMSIFQSCGHSP